MSFLLGPIVDATTMNPFMGGWGDFGIPMLTPPPMIGGGQGVFYPFNEAPLFPSATPEIGRGFYGSGLFGGVFSPWSMVPGPLSPLSLWGDDFYQHDKLAAGATLLGWGDTMLMTDPFLMHYRNWSSWPPIPFWPFSNPEQNSQQTPTQNNSQSPAQTQTAQNQSGRTAAEDPGVAEGRKELEARAKEIEAQANERQLELKKSEERVKEEADKRDKKFDERVERNEKETEEDRQKARAEAEADHQKRKREIEKATGKTPPPRARGGRAGDD